MSWPGIFFPGFFTVNRTLVTRFTEPRSQSLAIVEDSLRQLHKPRRAAICIYGCKTLSKIVFYQVIRSSLLLRFHTAAFLESACLLSAGYSEVLYSHRPVFHGVNLWCRLHHTETQESFDSAWKIMDINVLTATKQAFESIKLRFSEAMQIRAKQGLALI